MTENNQATKLVQPIPALAGNLTTVVLNQLEPTVNNESQAPEADVLSMPKEFRDYRHLTGARGHKVGLVIMTLSLILLLGMAWGAWVYIIDPYLEGQSKPPQQPASTKYLIQTTEPAAPIETAAALSPQNTALDYLQALKGVTLFDDYYAAVQRLGSQSKLQQVEADKLRLEAPGSDSAAISSLIAKEAPPVGGLDGRETITEKINGDQAEVVITLADNNGAVTISLVMENQIWKVNQLQWQGRAWPSETDELQMGEDRDNDGLTDAEEDLLGTNKDLADSDNDSYVDVEELQNLYNPAGSDKLVDSPKISSYLDPINHYSLLYPNTWQKTIPQQDSVMWQSADNQFIQIVIMPNQAGQAVDGWYKKTFSQSALSDDALVSGKTWQGVKSEDGLYYYLQGLSGNAILIIQYYPGPAHLLNYPAVFSAMVASLIIQ